MNNFENQLDVIRIQLYEETKEMDKEDIIRNVNSHAKKIAQEFGIKIESTVNEIAFKQWTNKIYFSRKGAKLTKDAKSLLSPVR